MEAKYLKPIKIWGIVKGLDGEVMPNVRIKLLKKVKKSRKIYYELIQQGKTNAKGEYDFEVETNEIEDYKVVVLEEMYQ